MRLFSKLKRSSQGEILYSFDDEEDTILFESAPAAQSPGAGPFASSHRWGPMPVAMGQTEVISSSHRRLRLGKYKASGSGHATYSPSSSQTPGNFDQGIYSSSSSNAGAYPVDSPPVSDPGSRSTRSDTHSHLSVSDTLPVPRSPPVSPRPSSVSDKANNRVRRRERSVASSEGNSGSAPIRDEIDLTTRSNTAWNATMPDSPVPALPGIPMAPVIVVHSPTRSTRSSSPSPPPIMIPPMIGPSDPAYPYPYPYPYPTITQPPIVRFQPQPRPEGSYRPRVVRMTLFSSKKTVSYLHIRRRRWERQGLDSLQERVHDLFSCSYVPLIEYHVNPEDITTQAVEFLSAFSDNALWTVNVRNLPRQQGEVLYGLTPNSRDPNVVARFLRFRFPFIRFEWHIETPFVRLHQYVHHGESVVVKTLWKAWSSSGSASGLVAYGFCHDTLQYNQDDCLVILNREFTVSKVFQPEMMMPVPYPIDIPPLPEHNEFMIFSASQTVLQALRSSQKKLTFLIAFSAFLTSLKPIVDPHSPKTGLALAGIGIITAMTSIITLFISWALERIEATAAKYRP